ncbi:metallophosphoesterase [Stenotrophomonas aracearum]|uniref:metallophosphoesterase n=1 Tax=Stenotrophomonas aracearum TaxID=3003272 RepID=UPI003CCE206D
MRILILSDLHLEVWRDAPRQAQEILRAMQPNLDVCRPDLVILAGDIDVGDRALAWADRGFPIVQSSMCTEIMRTTPRRATR